MAEELKQLNRDESRLALWQSMRDRSFGNPADDKLMLEWLWEQGIVLCKRAPAAPQPEPAAPETFMGEPVLTRWKPLNRDDSRLALWQSVNKREFGNPADDKLMLEWLWENGYALCKRVPDEAAPTRCPSCDGTGDLVRTDGEYLGKCFVCKAAAPTVVEPEPVAWEGGEGWESLARELCADENGEDACNELIWEGGAIPEPWGERWLKYEGEAKRLIALVHKHASHPPRTALTDAEIDAVTLRLWGNQTNVMRAAHRGYARAIERAHGITASEGDAHG